MFNKGSESCSVKKSEGIFKDLDLDEKVINDMIMKSREKWFEEKE